MDCKFHVRDVRSFKIIQLIQMQEQLSQRWLSCIRGTYTAVSWLY